MARPIGYYVHHHGDGHRQRALAIAHAAGGDMVLIGTGLAGRTDGHPCIDLEDDTSRSADGNVDGYGELPSSLHYAPVDHDGVRQRTARIVGWIAAERPALLVVDVSVEVAMLARLASVPTVYVRLSGRRLDGPHRDAFRASAALLAPYHESLDDEDTPHAIRQRTFYAPGIADAPVAIASESDVILVVIGRGGGSSDGNIWAEAAMAVPDRRWRVVGPCTVPASVPRNLDLRGWVDDVPRMIASAAIVVGGAGDGLVGSVIAARRPFICIPEPRPFDEQVSKARRLSELGAAIVVGSLPDSSLWGQLILQASALNTERLQLLDAPRGAERAAHWLRSLADQTNGTRSGTA